MKEPILGVDIEREFRHLSSRLSFGLNSERHRPEAVELPQRPVRKGDKVRVLLKRGSVEKGDHRLWIVKSIQRQKNLAELELLGGRETATNTTTLDDLVVAEFRGPIYPGLISAKKIEQGGQKPYQIVIKIWHRGH